MCQQDDTNVCLVHTLCTLNTFQIYTSLRLSLMFQTRLLFRVTSVYMSPMGFYFSFIYFVQFILDTEFKKFRKIFCRTFNKTLSLFPLQNFAFRMLSWKLVQVRFASLADWPRVEATQYWRGLRFPVAWHATFPSVHEPGNAAKWIHSSFPFPGMWT